MIRKTDKTHTDKLKRGASNVELPFKYGIPVLPCFLQDLETTKIYKAISLKNDILTLQDSEGKISTITITHGTRCRVRYVAVSRFVVKSLIGDYNYEK